MENASKASIHLRNQRKSAREILEFIALQGILKSLTQSSQRIAQSALRFNYSALFEVTERNLIAFDSIGSRNRFCNSVKEPITDYRIPITDYRSPITEY